MASSLLAALLLQACLLSLVIGGGDEGALTSYNLEKLPGNFDGSTVKIPLNNALFVVTKGQDCDANGKNCQQIGKLSYQSHDLLFFKLNSDNNDVVKNSFNVGPEKSGEIRVKFRHNGLWRSLLVTEGGTKAVVEQVKENPANMGEDSSSSDD